MADQAQQDQDQNEPEHIKELRQQARDASELRKQVESQQRELAFAKAGVDTESKLGSMLFKTFDGELNSDAIQAEAKEIGLLKAEGDTPPPPAPRPEDNVQTQQRQDLASGSLDDGTTPGTTGENPQMAGLKAARKSLAEGNRPEEAFREFLQPVLDAAVDGDERVIVGQN